MAGMDASQNALDTLRTVEFRETLKGYHRDDVDEYLERAAVEAEGLQEQLRQAGERLRQAGERIAQLEAALEQRPEQAAAAEPAVNDETLQRTLLLAQQFVDQTKADAEARAHKLLAEAEERAHSLTTEAEERAHSLTTEAETTAAQIAAEAERKLREEIERLDGIRTQLSSDVEAMARHLESERSRLRGALTEVISWVDDNLKPVGALSGQRNNTPSAGGRPAGSAPARPAPAGSAPVRAANGPAEPAQVRPTGTAAQ